MQHSKQFYRVFESPAVLLLVDALSLLRASTCCWSLSVVQYLDPGVSRFDVRRHPVLYCTYAQKDVSILTSAVVEAEGRRRFNFQ